VEELTLFSFPFPFPPLPDSGYAALFALQKELRNHFGITDDDKDRMRIFGAAASFLYFGNLIFRMGHNVVFAFLRPRNRVVVSFLSMITSMLILVSIFLFDVQWLGIVFFAYFFGGIGIGTFEANVLNVCTCCGPQTKLWAVIGIPIGVVVVTIGGFLLLQVGVYVQVIYAGVCVMLFIGLFLYSIRIWRTGLSARAPSVSEFIGDLRAFREWLPHVRWHAVMMAINMFFVSLLSPGLILYLYEGDPIELKPFSWKIPRNLFFAIYDAGFFIGDSTSRKIFYKRRTYIPFVFLIFTVLGGLCAFSTLPLIVPLGGFFVAFGELSCIPSFTFLLLQSIPLPH
jgi:hypothetical protein